MADKFRKVAPLDITFTAGEQPTANKLTQVSTQARNGLALLEYPIGDPWNQSGDGYLFETPLQIPNLARLLGQNSYLNPALYPGKDTFKFHEKVGERYENKTEGFLKFIPDGGTVTRTAGGAAFTTQVSNEYDVDSAGEFWVDSSTGRFRTYTVVTSSDRIYYNVDPSTSWITGTETLPGVIPDPNQADFTSCRISKVSSTIYQLHLPPRQALTLDANNTPARYPSSAEVTLNSIDNTVTSPPSLWQKTNNTALYGAHYRYRLPKDILDVIASKSAGTSLPAGMFYLWDQNSESIISGVVFKKSNQATNLTPTVGADAYSYEYIIDLDVSGSTFDFDAIDTADETEASYNNTNISLITCGAPVARSLWNITTQFLKHSHNINNTLEPVISHNDLDNQNPPISSYSGHTGRYPTAHSSWLTSRWSNDPHTSLLSRAGSYGTAHATRRDGNDNAMLGHLILANSQPTAGIFLDSSCTNDSFKLCFGAADGTSIHVDSTNGLTATTKASTNWNGLTVAGDGSGHGASITAGATGMGISAASTADHTIYGIANGVTGIGFKAGVYGVNRSSTGYGVYGSSDGRGLYGVGASGGTGVFGSSDSGWGLYSTSSTGQAAVLVGNATKAPLLITPSGPDDPITPAAGDVYVNSTTNQLVEYNGKVWAPVVQSVFRNSSTVQETGADLTNHVITGMTYTLDADTLRVGSTIRARLAFYVSTYGDSPIYVRVVILGIWGSNIIGECYMTGTDIGFVDTVAIVNVIGAASTAELSYSAIINESAGCSTDVYEYTTIFDTTGQNAVVATIDLADATDVVDIYQFMVDISG